MLIDSALLHEIQDTLDDAFQKGNWAGDQCYKRNENPYLKGTSLYEWWDAGWSNSLDELCGN